MSYDEIENLWRSPQNQPAERQMEEERQRFAARLRRRHIGFVAYFVFVLTALTALTIWIGIRWLAKGTLGSASAWPALFLLALPWAAAILFVRRYLQHRRRHPDYERSIATALQAARDENRTALARTTGILRLQAMCVPPLALCLWQLHATGLARKHEIWSMALFFGVSLTLSAGWTGLVCLTQLKKEAKRIDEVMKCYE
ncbi:MAG TPA: hypothetical protein VG796_00365 [Verrucomicrobiales bacterium]|nr:hypothetical protein [Verrucomicrobiales bacterium]